MQPRGRPHEVQPRGTAHELQPRGCPFELGATLPSEGYFLTYGEDAGGTPHLLTYAPDHLTYQP